MAIGIFSFLSNIYSLYSLPSDAARKLIGKLDYLVQYFYITNILQKFQVEKNVCDRPRLENYCRIVDAYGDIDPKL
ncbi:hypothetical protein [Nostoc sp.]|uniref:hypothetical protein n=1 Tax=Nostoc sp. TaxID=1180 RepID=UPI002FF77713